MSPLICAAGAGSYSAAKALVDLGAAVDKRLVTAKGYTPLLFAAEFGKDDIVELLLDNGANIEKTMTGRGLSPLMLAAGEGHVSTVELLMRRGARLDPADALGKDALFCALFTGQFETLQVLLEAGALVSAGLIKMSTQSKQKEIADLLITHGRLQIEEGRRNLKAGTLGGQLRKERLAKKVAAVAAKEEEEARVRAEARAAVDAIEWRPSKEVSHDGQDSVAAEGPTSETLEPSAYKKKGDGALVEASQNRRAATGKAPSVTLQLLAALSAEDAAAATALVTERGSDIDWNEADDEGKTPVILAAMLGDSALVKLMVGAGASI